MLNVCKSQINVWGCFILIHTQALLLMDGGYRNSPRCGGVSPHSNSHYRQDHLWTVKKINDPAPTHRRHHLGNTETRQGAQALLPGQVVQVVKNPPAKASDMGSVLRLERSPGGGNSNPPQYSCLENPMDGGV